MLVATEAQLCQWVRDTKKAIRKGLGLRSAWDDLVCWTCPEPVVVLDERGEPVRLWWMDGPS